jgi:hypothetical protein
MPAMFEDQARRRVIVYKRWLLRDQVTADHVAAIVRDSIEPMYRRLSGAVALGLELSADGRSVLAIQRWQSRRALERALSGPRFERWWSQYQPILAQWDDMVVFDSEWETIELLA